MICLTTQMYLVLAGIHLRPHQATLLLLTRLWINKIKMLLPRRREKLRRPRRRLRRKRSSLKKKLNKRPRPKRRLRRRQPRRRKRLPEKLEMKLRRKIRVSCNKDLRLKLLRRLESKLN